MQSHPNTSAAAEWLRFCLVPNVSGHAQRTLLAAFGSPQAIFQAGIAAISDLVGRSVAEALMTGPDPSLVQRTLNWLDTPNHRLLTLGDPHYPGGLLQIPDPPTMVYAKGDVELLNHPAIAIVGSRNATQQGLCDAHAFAKTLSNCGYTIISGLAVGIDAAAHEGGLAGHSRSVAIVGTGLDRVYPAANLTLAHRLAESGALLSEFPLGVPPMATNFPRRNRLISGLSRGVLVVEAALRSGSLTTARLALDQGRDVFSLPGSIHSPLSKGCHWLIKQGAKLVEDADDVLTELGATPHSTSIPIEKPASGSCVDQSLLSAIGHSPASLDVLVARSGRQAADVAAELSRLELDGLLERLAGGLYRRLQTSS